jgi:hypothetical protein
MNHTEFSLIPRPTLIDCRNWYPGSSRGLKTETGPSVSVEAGQGTRFGHVFTSNLMETLQMHVYTGGQTWY